MGTHFVDGQCRGVELFLKSFAQFSAGGAAGNHRGEDGPGQTQFVDDFPIPGAGAVVKEICGGNVGVFS